MTTDHTRCDWMPVAFEARNAPRWHGTNVYYQIIKAERNIKVAQMSPAMQAHLKEHAPSLAEIKRRAMYGY